MANMSPRMYPEKFRRLGIPYLMATATITFSKENPVATMQWRLPEACVQ